MLISTKREYFDLLISSNSFSWGPLTPVASICPTVQYLVPVILVSP
ncbi:MAG: hypothetical protein HWN79_12330 [Candidatus Lokiarchaeota archaeon]|nr:hypothetical protein [Candidatus Lokiarchaeota archaeon]